MTDRRWLRRNLALILAVLLFLAPMPAYALPIMADTEALGDPDESQTEPESESQTAKETSPEETEQGGEKDSESDTASEPQTEEDEDPFSRPEETETESEAETVPEKTDNSPIYNDELLARSNKTAPDLHTQGAIVVEATTGQVIFEKNSHQKLYPASTTKVMTALLTYEHGNLDDLVTAKASAVYHNSLVSGGSTAGIEPGEEMTVRQLLYCLLLPSANEAACVLGEYVAGSVEAFVTMMNERAAELGCPETHFTTPHGLTNENHYTSAHDLYCIAYEFAKHDELMEIANTTGITLPATNKHGERVLNTTNHLISTRTKSNYIYEYARGIKTGYTSAAKHCLISTAQKDGMYLICVVMKSPVLEGNVVTSFVDTKALYEWGFKTYELKNILKKGTAVTEAYVSLSADKDSLVLETDRDISILIPKGSYDESKLEVTPPETVTRLTAPVYKGEQVAEASVAYDGVDCGKVGLITATGAELSEFMDVTTKTESFFKSKTFILIPVLIPVLFVLYLIYISIASRRRRRKTVYGKRYR